MKIKEKLSTLFIFLNMKLNKFKGCHKKIFWEKVSVSSVKKITHENQKHIRLFWMVPVVYTVEGWTEGKNLSQ